MVEVRVLELDADQLLWGAQADSDESIVGSERHRL